MLSSSYLSKRTLLSAFGPAAGVVACMAFPSVALAQNECTNAATAVVGANPFTTVGATASANPPTDALCPGTYLDWQTSADIWFVFNPTGQGALSLSTCDSLSYDTSIAVYSGTCAGLTMIACNGDGTGGSGCQAYYSAISNLFIDGSSAIYVRIGGYQGATGAGTLTLAFQEVAFQECIDSTESCATVHATGGCMDTTCCESVCGAYPPCCETGWEQLCVDLAVDACGLFVYNCPGGGPSNDCATNPTVVNADSTLNFDSSSANTDGPPQVECNSSNDDAQVHKDLWYRFTAAANGVATATNCNLAQFDSKIAFYDVGDWSQFDPGNLPSMFMACNEDCAEDATYFTSTQSANVVLGRTYLVRLGGFEGASGAGQIHFDLPDPCALPASGGSENEPCGDSVNPGCGEDTVSIVATNLPLNVAYSGNFWADGDTRDTDWYQIVITQDALVSLDVWSASFVGAFILSGSPCDPDNLVFLSIADGTCPSHAEACLTPGVYYVFVGLTDSTGAALFSGVPCDSGALNDYVVKVSTTPQACPVLLDTVCDSTGPDNLTLNTSADTGFGIVQCGVAGPTGYSVDSHFARSFPAGATVDSGEIRCVTFGIACFKYITTTTIQVSDIPQTGSIAIYTDNNGGNPVNVPPAATADLTLLVEVPFSAPGGFYAATVTFDTPLCIDGNTQNIVVVAHLNEVVPNNAGYRLACAGSNVGAVPATFVMFPACGATYNDFVSYTAGNPARTWYVNLNGDFAACSSNCPGDFNDDGIVDGADLGFLLGGWGAGGGNGPADFNEDGIIDGADLGTLLGFWGACD